STTRGTPAIARSMGTVTYCSISTGDSAGADVMTWTCTLVRSGTASIGSLRAACTPKSTSSNVATSTMGRLRNDQPMMAERARTSVLLAEGALEHGALEREDAVDDHLLARAQAGDDLDLAGGGATERDAVDLEVAVGLAYEDA